MGLRRGLLFGFLVGAFGVAAGRFASGRDDSAQPGTEGALRSFVADARDAAYREQQAVEQRLRHRFDEARQSGHVPHEQ